MRKSSLIICLLMTTVILPACSQSVSFEATVSAGKYCRRHTPVFVEVGLSESFAGESAEVKSDMGVEPAQFEKLGADKARIWWIVTDLPAGAKRSYTIRLDASAGASESGTFSWRDTSTDKDRSTDLLFGGRGVLRYMHTPFDRKDIPGTGKPFHHVYDNEGKRFITKGVGGRFSHHRRIFFGYKDCKIGGKDYDTWHAHQAGHQLHKEVLDETAGPVFGGHELRINWNDPEGNAFAEEIRRLTVFRQPEGQLLIDFQSRLRSTAGAVSLGGDRQHAGVQFRASQEVADHQDKTRYLRPANFASLPVDKEINTAEHRDLPWNAIQYKLGEQAFTVAYLSDPSNPDGADFSERLYGRFGEFFPWELRNDNPLSVHYRWWITASHEVTREQIEERYQDLANPPAVVLGG